MLGLMKALSVFSFDVEPSPALELPPTTPTFVPPPPARQGRRPTRGRSTVALSRHSAHLATRSNGDYVAVPNQAVERKALLNALSGCSAALKKQATKRNILSHNKIPLSVTDIRKLVSAAGASCSSAASVRGD